ncbi:Membrane protein involved in the export of O-antigen and teichoic acid [Reichenbachiella faecimaris]|uniref:Membrane protein involved in the export of O-antigen and teichoic acid n=1 Tax=Reichenbachiella faecimaris TaxID=692418 RepID=A0A1W2GCV6_REIFA|nr:oligosaccharide flippase family protein [Reichenbachiella faecimaris]SMD34178.1 Membrane protein involved in the export of O-antigen and teichoic acid [Reichenbachiella faecimaris]
MSSIKGLAGDTMWYGLSSIIGRMISYLLVPLYTAVFLPGEYGIVTELYAYIAFLYPLFTYGMETAYFRYANKNPEEEPALFNLLSTFMIISSFILVGLLFWFGTDMAIWLDYKGKEVVFYWLAAVLGVDAMVILPFARLRFRKQPRKFAMIRFFNITFAVILNLFFLVFCLKIYQGEWFLGWQAFMLEHYDFEFKAKYVFLSNLISNSFLIILLIKEFNGFHPSFNWKRLAPILLYATPLLFMGLAGVTNEMLSRALLKIWLPNGFYPDQSSLAALGVFGACYKLSVFMMLGIQAFRYAAEPFFFSNAENKDSPKLFAKIMTGFVIFCVLVFVVISLNLEVIGLIFFTNPAYREGLYVVPVLLMAYLFNGIYYNLSVWYKVTDRTIYGAGITIFGAIVTVALNFLLIPVMGYFGSSIVTLISYFLMAATSYLFGQKYYHVPYQVFAIGKYILLSSLLVYGFYQFDSDNWRINFLIRNLGVLIFVFGTYMGERKHLSGRVVFGFKIP